MTLDDLHDYYRRGRLSDTIAGRLGATEEYWIKKDASHLIIWKEDNEIIGHAIWHETGTNEHKKGDPRDEEDREALRRLVGRKKDDIIELHEVWLKKKYRGKGYGRKFFEFFEQFVRNKGYNSIVYYTDHPTATKICRSRGYSEGFLKKENWLVFCISF